MNIKLPLNTAKGKRWTLDNQNITKRRAKMDFSHRNEKVVRLLMSSTDSAVNIGPVISRWKPMSNAVFQSHHRLPQFHY